jgi:hypothetical protein
MLVRCWRPYFLDGIITAVNNLDLLRNSAAWAGKWSTQHLTRQQDCAPPHHGRYVRTFLNATFPVWIWRRGTVEWPPSSPNLTPVIVHHKRCGIFSQTSPSAMTIKTVCFSETLISTHKSTRRYNPEDQHRQLHCLENLKSLSFLLAKSIYDTVCNRKTWHCWQLSDFHKNSMTPTLRATLFLFVRASLLV